MALGPCICISSRFGTILAGIWVIIMSIGLLVMTILAFRSNEDWSYFGYEICHTIATVVAFIDGILKVTAGSKRTHRTISAAYFFQFVFCATIFVIMLLLFVLGYHWVDSLILLIPLVFGIYFIFVVSDYKKKEMGYNPTENS